MDSKEDIRLLFKDLFTHTEYKMFAKRLEIARQLLASENYESIMRKLNVTSHTITNINNILANKGDGLRKANEKLKELEQKYKELREKRQNVLERRIRPKLPGEDVLPNLIKVAALSGGRAIAKTIKHRSARKELLV